MKEKKKRHENLLWYRIFVLFIFYKDRNYGRKSESLTMFLRLTRTQFSFISASWVNDNLVHHVHHCIECSVSLLVSCAKLSPGRKQTFFFSGLIWVSLRKIDFFPISILQWIFLLKWNVQLIFIYKINLWHFHSQKMLRKCIKSIYLFYQILFCS